MAVDVLQAVASCDSDRMIGGVFLVSYGKGDEQMKFAPPVADLTSPAVQGKLDARLFRSVHDGKLNAAMGAWRESLADDEIWDALAYVRTLAPEQTGGMGSGLR